MKLKNTNYGNRIFQNKKSQAGVQFHWIFVLIAGAIILTFFVSIVVKQKDISESKIAGKAIESLDQIFTAASATENTFNKIDIPKIKIEFVCRQDFSEYSIRKTGQNRNLFSEIVFSSDLIKGNSVFIWSLPWKMPFAVDNFIMITSPEIRYVIIYSADKETTATSVYDNLPEQITKELVLLDNFKLGKIKDKNNYKIKLIFITKQDPINLNLPKWMKDEDVSILWAPFRQSGNFIKFYKKETTSIINPDYANEFSIKSAFTDDSKDPMFYGAIFTEDAQTYSCTMKKAYQRLYLVSKIYKQRTDSLVSDVIDPTNTCKSMYVPQRYPALISASKQCSDNPDNCPVSTIIKKAEEITFDNVAALNFGCPSIY